MRVVPRVLLAFSALILVVGGLMHAAAFGKTLAAVDASGLAPYYANSFKALWLIDSATLITLSAVFAFIALQPESGNRIVVMFLAVIPAATAFFLYKFMGNFLPAHMLITAAVAAVLGALRL